MKTRYRIIRRGNRGDTFYCVDAQTRKRTSLNTSDLKAAQRIVEAKNQAEEQPAINRQLAKAYLSGTDNGIATRTWQEAMVRKEVFLPLYSSRIFRSTSPPITTMSKGMPSFPVRVSA